MRWTYWFEMRYLLEVSGFEVAAEYFDLGATSLSSVRGRVFPPRG